MHKYVSPPNEAEAKSGVVFLRNKSCPNAVGYHIGGNYSGPNVLVAGYAPTSHLVYKRLQKLPTLPWLRGSLTLIHLNTQRDLEMRDQFLPALETRPDEVFFLPYAIERKFSSEAAKEGFWSILRLCAKLGMISGRGIPSLNQTATQTGFSDA